MTYELDLTEVFRGNAKVAHKVAEVLAHDRSRFMAEIKQATTKVVEAYLENITFGIVHQLGKDPLDGPKVVLKVTVPD